MGRALSAYDVGLSAFPDADSRRPFLGDSPGTVTVPQQPGADSNLSQSVINDVVNWAKGEIGKIGGPGKYGTPESEGAEQARVDAAVLGAEHGSVQAIQYLLGQAQSDTSDYAKQATQFALSKLQLAYPTLFAQAQQLGPMFDTADGMGVLTILSNLGLPFTDQYAGWNTTNVTAGSPQAMVLAQKLKTLSPSLVPGLPATVTMAGTTVNTNTLLLAGGLVVALVVGLKKKRA